MINIVEQNNLSFPNSISITLSNKHAEPKAMFFNEFKLIKLENHDNCAKVYFFHFTGAWFQKNFWFIHSIYIINQSIWYCLTLPLLHLLSLNVPSCCLNSFKHWTKDTWRYSHSSSVLGKVLCFKSLYGCGSSSLFDCLWPAPVSLRSCTYFSCLALKLLPVIMPQPPLINQSWHGMIPLLLFFQ